MNNPFPNQDENWRTVAHREPDEAAFLAAHRARASLEIQLALRELQSAAIAKPRELVESHPLATAVTALGAGIGAGWLLAPHRTPNVKSPESAPREPQASVPPEVAADATPPADSLQQKLIAGAKSALVGAAYGLGRLALTRVLEGMLAGAPSDTNWYADVPTDSHPEAVPWPTDAPA